jgi:hypothetical protein
MWRVPGMKDALVGGFVPPFWSIPTHTLVSCPSTGQNKIEKGMIAVLLEACPPAAAILDEGVQLPFHLAIDAGGTSPGLDLSKLWTDRIAILSSCDTKASHRDNSSISSIFDFLKRLIRIKLALRKIEELPWRYHSASSFTT